MAGGANQNMMMVYQAAINNGLSPNQARAWTAEVGRENGFQDRYLFGGHTDAANKKANLGLISWQGARRDNLRQYLNQRGLLNADGSIKRGQAALDAQTAFAIDEMKNGGKAYEATRRQFLNNPNVGYQTAARVLGKNFIRWDYDGKTINAAQHHARRDGFYNQIATATNGKTFNPEPQQQPQHFYQMGKGFDLSVNQGNQRRSSAAQPVRQNYFENQDYFGAQNNDEQSKTNMANSWLFPTEQQNNQAKAIQEMENQKAALRLDDWRITPLEFNKNPAQTANNGQITDTFSSQFDDKINAAFGGVPDTSDAMPDYLAILARQIYDDA